MALILPLLFDQLLNVLVGMADTVMVSTVGEAAVSGVSLVDNLNMFFLMIFAGLATGGSIICAQLLGLKKLEQAQDSGNQLLLITGLISLVFFVISILGNVKLLAFLFGNIDAQVMENAGKYFTFIAISLPFLAIHNSCAALFRATGDSKTPMKISLLMNAINLLGNAFCLFVLHLGVLGVAIPTLCSRVIAAVTDILVISKEDLAISQRHFSFRLHLQSVRRILSLAIPASIESGIFQIGKILVLGLISSLGTLAITANAVANSLLTFQTLTEDALGIAMITVVGQCVGAGEYEQSRAYTKKLLKYTYLLMWAVNIPMLFAGGSILKLYHLSASTGTTTLTLFYYNCICGITIWPASFTLPCAMRAEGKVGYTMGISLFSMWVFRIGLSFLLVKVFDKGLYAIYLCYGADWLFRVFAFVGRFMKDGRKAASVSLRQSALIVRQ